MLYIETEHKYRVRIIPLIQKLKSIDIASDFYVEIVKFKDKNLNHKVLPVSMLPRFTFNHAANGSITYSGSHLHRELMQNKP